MTTLADSSLLLSLKDDDPSLSLDDLLVVALECTSWDPSFVLRALSFLAECAASPSFIQRDFPAEFVKYGFSPLILPPFEEMVDMARVLDYLGFPVTLLSPLIREIQEHSAFDSFDVKEYPAFSTKKVNCKEPSFFPFLVSNGLLPLVQRVFHGEEKVPRVCTVAAANGHLDVLRWLRTQDPPCPWNEWVCCYAAQNGHLDVLKWLRAQDPPCPWNEWVCCYAAQNGQLDVLKWLRAQDPPCPWNTWTCANAAYYGHLDVLKWSRSQDPPCPWDEMACAYAAQNGHLAVLKWLRSQYPLCPWNEDACSFAAGNGHLDVLKWMRAQVPLCPWNKEECIRMTEKSDMRTWIQEQP
jgi:hypothetical protein